MSGTYKHAIIVCHPDLESFTMAVADRYAKTVRGHAHEAIIRDLYRMQFDPVLKAEERRGDPAEDVVQEWNLLGEPDVFVLVYPIWFGTPPAMLKGYIDRVFGAGRARLTNGGASTAELLSGRRLVSLTSSGSLRAWLDEKGVLGSLHTVYDRYLADVFGFAATHRYHFDGVTDQIPERDIRMHLFDLEQAARHIMSRMVSRPQIRSSNLS